MGILQDSVILTDIKARVEESLIVRETGRCRIMGDLDRAPRLAWD